MVGPTIHASKSINDKTRRGRINSGRISKGRINNGNSQYPRHSKSEDRIRLDPILGERLTPLHPLALREGGRAEAKAETDGIDNAFFLFSFFFSFLFPPVKTTK